MQTLSIAFGKYLWVVRSVIRLKMPSEDDRFFYLKTCSKLVYIYKKNYCVLDKKKSQMGKMGR